MLRSDHLEQLTPELISFLTPQEREELVNLVEERQESLNREKLFQLYPNTGPLRRELYPKHCELFAAGIEHRERCMMAANRIGKTWGVGGYETALHLTGRYPDWWEGRRFDRPVDGWAAGDTSETTRDIVQLALTGVGGEAGESSLGTGLIPAEDIVGEPTHRRGIAGAYDTIVVKHQSGGHSKLGFKSYDQGRKKFQGTSKDVVWLDEEPPMDVYSECLLRTMTTNGLVLCTFTPLSGMTEVALQFLQGE
jgi:phage terminase large subunit-like protein